MFSILVWPRRMCTARKFPVAFRSSKRMCSIVFASKSDRRDPLINEMRLLPRAHMGRVVDAAGERIVLDRSAPTLEPRQEAAARVGHDFELNWPARLLLNYDCPRSQFSTRH